MNEMLNIPTVMLMEDNPTDAELTLKAFKKHNLTNIVHWVEDSQEVLNYLFCTAKFSERNLLDQPKVILLDLKLPKVDGLEVLRTIKSDAFMEKVAQLGMYWVLLNHPPIVK